MSKELKVKLTNTHPKVDDRFYTIDHATRILKRKNTGGWYLPEDSKFIFDKAHGIIDRPSKGDVQKPKKQG